MKLLEDKVCIITGATSGIGAATARYIAKEDANIVLVGRNSERGRKIENEINTNGGKAFFIQCDVAKEKEALETINKTVDSFGKIDILFNNAGVMLPSMEIERMPFEDWNKTFSVNVNGFFLMCKYAKPYLQKSKGCIINNASIAGMHSYVTGRSYAYSASKAAVIQFTRQMAKNYAEEGIRVNSVSPGIIETPALNGRGIEVYGDRIPMKRLGTPEEVAKVVLFLASDQASYITGINIPVDGGVSI